MTELYIDEKPVVKVLPGDVNGDGKISSMDYVLVKNHILSSMRYQACYCL